MSQGAQRYLAERLLVARERPPTIAVLQWRQQMPAGFGGALEALRAGDAVDADEVHDWMNRMHIALGIEPLDPMPPGSNFTRAVYTGEGERPPPTPEVPVARFLNLIPVQGADAPVPYGGRLQILGIERY